MIDDQLRRLAGLEQQLHLCWQRMDEEARQVRHLTMECQRLLLDMRRELSQQIELLPEVGPTMLDDDDTQSVINRVWDAVAGKWVYLPEPG